MPDEQDRPVQPQPPAEPPDATTMHLPAVGAAQGADERATEVGEPAQAEPATPSAVEPGTVASLRAGTALLRVDHGPNAGSRFLLDGDVTTVGRHPSSDIFLDDVTVSRKHAEFVREGTSFSVRDVGSLNGTYVNRQRIDSSPLATGDEVQVGKFRLVVMLGEAE